MCIDFIRRFFWTLIRLENEQINNPEGYRQILEIPEVIEHDDKNERVEEKKLAQMLQRIKTTTTSFLGTSAIID
jgi:hypothetical protein